MQGELLTMKEMAKRLKIGYRTFQRWVYEGEIPYIQVRSRRRFDPEEVIAALKERKEGNGN